MDSLTNQTSAIREVDDVRNFHDEAYLYLDQALSLEEQRQTGEALPLYERGLHKLDMALAIRCDRPACIGESWDAARLLQLKMRKMRDHVLCQLEGLSKEWAARADAPRASTDFLVVESPPSYEEAISSDPDSASIGAAAAAPSWAPEPDAKSYRELCATMEHMDAERPRGIAQQRRCPSYDQVPAEAEEIFSIPRGVQIFFVSTMGSVSAPSYPNELSIHRLRAEKTSNKNSNTPPAFLRVGEWVYPLHPGLMPMLHTTYGAYMFPDTNSSLGGAAIGLLLADEVDRTTREVFEHLLCELTAYRSEPGTPESREAAFSAKFSRGLVQGAEVISKGAVAGAYKTSEYIRSAAAKWRANMETDENPTQIDPRIRTGLKMARDVSGVAVKVSGYLLGKLGEATMALGQQLAPHIRKQGASLYCRAMGIEETGKAEGALDGVMEVAAGGLRGFSTVYMGLERAANILAESLIAETVQTVNHKYGAQAADTTDNALHSVGNVAMASHNVSHMGIKGVAKRAAKDTGKALVHQHCDSKALNDRTDDNSDKSTTTLTDKQGSKDDDKKQ